MQGNYPKKKTVNRDLAILKIGFTTGLPISSILQIDVQDVNLEKRIIKLHEGKKPARLVTFGKNLAEQLDLWIKDREIYFGDAKTDALFVSSYRKRITRDGVAKMLMKYSVDVTDKNVTPQVMRNSAMSNLLKKRATLSYVKLC